MKLKFFPTIENITNLQSFSRNPIFTRALRWLSPDKRLELMNMAIFRNGKTVDYYWYSHLPIPKWQDGTGRKANYDKAIRNLQRLINEKPQITHFTISDNDNEFSYNKLTDTNFEEYEWDFNKLD